MLIGDTFIYLELLKTASSHTRNILENISSMQIEAFGKHTTLSDLQSPDQWKNKTIIGNIRNPWDWYVSHWAFGCMQRGGMYKRFSNHTLGHITRSPKLVLSHLSRFRKNQHVLNTFYADSTNKDLFKQWLYFVLFNPTLDVEHNYFNRQSYKIMGLYSYEYINMYTHPDQVQTLTSKSHSIKEIEPSLVYDHLIPMETLEEGTLGIAGLIGTTEQKIKKSMESILTKTNTSKRKNYQHYYDEESKKWIMQRDQLIINLHNYSF